MSSRECRHESARAGARRASVPRVLAFSISQVLALLAFALLPALASAQDRPKWWEKGTQWKYRALVSAPQSGGVYKVWLYTGKRASPSGGDIWLVGPSEKTIPFTIVHSTNEGRHLVLFKEPKGESKGAYAFYFGNASATPVARAFPEAGLVLKTRPIPDKPDVETWKGAEATLRRAPFTFGADSWPQVFDAYNPFGPQSDYIAIYEGVIDCPTEGAYKFATMSDDASFLLIDNEVVAQWPGRKPRDIQISRRGEMSGQKQLKAGPHAFMYVGFAFGGVKRMAAAWQLPGNSRFDLIPPSAFATVRPAKVVLMEDQGRSICAGVSSEPVHYLESDDARIRMVAVQFSSVSSVHVGQIRELAWDFGDGVTSSQRDPLHVFIGTGKYDLKLTATASPTISDTFEARFDAQPNWKEPDYTFANRLKFWDWIKDYPVARMPTASLLALAEFLVPDISKPGDPDLLRLYLPDAQKVREQRTKAHDVCVELDKRRAELKPPQLCAVALFLAEYNLEPLKRWQQAEKYFNLAMSSLATDDAERRTEIRFKIADLYFYYAADAAKAKSAYAALRADLPKADTKRRRLITIRLGDIERDQGHIDVARTLYQEAESDLAFLPKEPRAIIDGRFSIEIESGLRQGTPEAALAKIEEWVWLYPTKRLDGLPMVLRLRANLQLRNYDEVIKQSGLFLKFSADPEWLPRVHLLAAQACEGQGKKEDARGHCLAILDKWPESSVSKDAKLTLEKLK